ncbi:tRNA lysidine(34) synthetase TilS [Robertmurraya kyonggiensis]|uniref:tRNA(Ile)-lysidine synthase n=1 Tax=Robertmurraya kyonggiensis TaxID=1037680 RepID=A0A4U1CWE4_9BACI|nr:tRNA lysidine(34) synthetase TilS [Robertmurraya kyonggiensis]TKC13913.1 tRNA lysidine(34) synthetase TilS [Robertmurraya kyonggiensis]
MLERKVEAFFEKRQFSIKNQGILVGVSGGPDSLALLHFLWSQKDKWNLQIWVAHVDHMFRGEESEEEALFVKRFCENRKIPFEMTQIDIPAHMEKSGLSSQVAARECRYAFFQEVMDKNKLSYLALGHHGDDQIETILMRLTRGSTGKARAGIPFSRKFHNGVLVRPFLCLNREEIEEYCRLHQLEPRRDPSNEKDVYSRNRFRKYMLPFLRKENPQVHEQFQRFSEELERDEAFLIQLTEERLESVITEKTSTRISIDIEAFNLMPLPLQRRGIQLILNYLYKVRPASLSAIHIEKIFFILKSPHPSGTLDFPSGLKVVRSYQECYFQFHTHKNQTSYKLEVNEPGEVILPNGDILTLEILRDDVVKNMTPTQHLLYMEEDVLPMIIRTRKNGDRMTIKGMNGTKKLKNLFIDEKVPIHKRNGWPVVTDRNDQIIWVPGLKKSNLYTVHDCEASQRIILLTYISNDLLGGTAKHEK